MVFVVVGRCSSENGNVFVIDYIFFVNVFLPSCNDIFNLSRVGGSFASEAPRTVQCSPAVSAE
jgi:hypothetical protein